MKKIMTQDFDGNVFQLLNKDWALISAGDENSSNMMTVSWGGLGILWNKPVATIYIRPQRHTYQFIENQDTFSITFFDAKYHSALSYCGSHSGKTEDKYEKSNLHKIMIDGTPSLEEAKLTFICKKLYSHDIDPKLFLNDQIDRDNYPKKDYHRAYIAEIISIYVNE